MPIPTIIEAAEALYAGHNVREISRSHAGAKNQIEVAHAATLDANQRLVRCRHGSWDLLNLQYLRSSEFIQDDCFHPAQRFADAFAAETAALRASR